MYVLVSKTISMYNGVSFVGSLNKTLNKQWCWRWFESLTVFSGVFLIIFCGTNSAEVIRHAKMLWSIFFNLHDDVIKWRHFPRYWPFVRGIHRSSVNSPHKGQWRGTLMFSLICAWINDWVNNGEAGDLRRYRAHYDVTVMFTLCHFSLWHGHPVSFLLALWQCRIFLKNVVLVLETEHIKLSLGYNTLRTKQNGRDFADDIFTCIFLNENIWISIKISLMLIPEGSIDNISALV